MITDPIAYCAEDRALIDQFEALPPEAQVGTFWSDPLLSDLKTRVKAFYIAAQRTRCCYCNRHLGSENHRLWDVEHIASRAKHARFMFTPTNLAAACPDCNMEKGEKEALVNSRRKTYPKDSAGFRLVHPHFDKFDEHIFHHGHVYLPKSTKGTETIRACNLLRFAERFIDWKNRAVDTRFEAEVDTVFEERPMESQAAVEVIVAKLPPR